MRSNLGLLGVVLSGSGADMMATHGIVVNVIAASTAALRAVLFTIVISLSILTSFSVRPAAHNCVTASYHWTRAAVASFVDVWRREGLVKLRRPISNAMSAQLPKARAKTRRCTLSR